MNRVLIVAQSEKSLAPLVEILEANDFSEIETVLNGKEARQLSAVRAFDLCIVNTPLPDEFGDVFATDMAERGTQTMLLVREDIYDASEAKNESKGIFTLPKPLNKGMMVYALKLARAAEWQIKHLAEKNRKLSGQLDDLRILSRAKCLLMQYLKFSENAAHKYIEKQAMDLRMTKVEVAHNILKTYEN